MTALAKVALVVDNTRTHKQRSKRTTPSQSFLTDKHSIYGGKAEVLLVAFAEAVANRDSTATEQARQALHSAAGDAVVVDAAGVAANFQRMVRIADSVGIPVDDMESEFGKETRAELSLEKFHSAQNSF